MKVDWEREPVPHTAIVGKTERDGPFFVMSYWAKYARRDFLEVDYARCEWFEIAAPNSVFVIEETGRAGLLARGWSAFRIYRQFDEAKVEVSCQPSRELSSPFLTLSLQREARELFMQARLQMELDNVFEAMRTIEDCYHLVATSLECVA